MSLYDYMLFEMKKNNIRYYYRRNEVFIGDFSLLDATLIDDLYTNNTDNDMYAYKIHDFTLDYNSTLKNNLDRPNEQNIKFDKNKIENYTSINESDVKNDVSLNDLSFDIIKTNGKKLSFQQRTNTSYSNYELENVLLQNNVFKIVVPGNYSNNDIGNRINIVLKGNPTITDTSLEGDIFHSGEYVISNIQETYIGDKMIQRLTLNRYDFGE